MGEHTTSDGLRSDVVEAVVVYGFGLEEVAAVFVSPLWIEEAVPLQL